MSWSSGSRLFANIAESIAEIVADDEERAAIYKCMIEEFSNFDCDTLFECTGIDDVLDEILEETYGSDSEEDEDEDEEEWPDGGREDF